MNQIQVFIFNCDQVALWMALSICPSVCPSVCLWHLFHYVPIIVSSCNLVITNDRSDVNAKGQGQRSKLQRSQPYLIVVGPLLQFEFTNDDEMIHEPWCCLGEVPYWFSRSSVEFEGHTAKKIVEFDPDWAFPDCNSSLNPPMATKLCTKLEVA